MSFYLNAHTMCHDEIVSRGFTLYGCKYNCGFSHDDSHFNVRIIDVLRRFKRRKIHDVFYCEENEIKIFNFYETSRYLRFRPLVRSSTLLILLSLDSFRTFVYISASSPSSLTPFSPRVDFSDRKCQRRETSPIICIYSARSDFVFFAF